MNENRLALRSLLAAVRGEQWKPTIILLSSTFLMVTWRYAGSTAFFSRMLERSGRHFELATVATMAAAYSFFACFFLLGVIPLLIVKYVFRERLADYGVQLGDRARTWRMVLIFVPLFLFSGYLSSNNPALRYEYPINTAAGESTTLFFFHACTYLFFYLSWEFHFRGFLQCGLQKSLGLTNAILIQVMASTLLHIGKPGVETYSAILGGILWGMLAYYTRSLLSGLAQHATLGIALDWFICHR